MRVVLSSVQTPVEFSRGHIKKAINCNVLDKKKFLKSIDVLNKEKPVYLYCQSGNRSWVASKILVDLGFELIYDLKGGYSRWRD
jgi:rhodanese-related sulfurtransferase